MSFVPQPVAGWWHVEQDFAKQSLDIAGQRLHKCNQTVAFIVSACAQYSAGGAT